ncbi:MAG: GGDEF domain-containing protein [Rhodospirillaceae bacterium]|nr:GGDEF domain-containing protein [Rhodospirillales bacterium]
MADDTLSLQSVLESVVRITEQRSRENLEHCLVSTLIELSGVMFVGIARPQHRSNGIHIECLARAERGQGILPQAPCDPMEEQPLMARALATGTEASETRANGHEYRCLPVMEGDNTVAFLMVESDDGLKASVNVVRAFAAVYRNYLAILRDSERDTLTGLKNRKTFDNNINRVIAQTRAANPANNERRQHEDDEHHWLGIVDIDHFKRVNDTHGHIFGDEVLLLFAALMRKVFRAEDQLFRFGGEEFVVVLAPTTAERARQAFERLRAAVEGFAFPQVGRVTASVGFVRIAPDDIPSKVVGQADEALYWGKRNGRNRVCWYDDLLKAGELSPHEREGGMELF